MKVVGNAAAESPADKKDPSHFSPYSKTGDPISASTLRQLAPSSAPSRRRQTSLTIFSASRGLAEPFHWHLWMKGRTSSR